ncbi:MAG: hypothetical protein R6V04_02515 [bacterium]
MCLKGKLIKEPAVLKVAVCEVAIVDDRFFINIRMLCFKHY